MSKEKIIVHLRSVLDLLGATAPEFLRTPDRLADLYLSWFAQEDRPRWPSGIHAMEASDWTGQEVSMQAIPFCTLCPHHLTPTWGTVDIRYRVVSHIMGVSHLPELVSYCAHRPQLQEQLCHELVAVLRLLLKTPHVYVAVTAEHGCALVQQQHHGPLIVSKGEGDYDATHCSCR